GCASAPIGPNVVRHLGSVATHIGERRRARSRRRRPCMPASTTRGNPAASERCPCNPATRAASRLGLFRSGTVIALLGTLLARGLLLRTLVADEFALAADFRVGRRIGRGRRINAGLPDFILPAFAASH